MDNTIWIVIVAAVVLVAIGWRFVNKTKTTDMTGSGGAGEKNPNERNK
jgi:hypothetical protein